MTGASKGKLIGYWALTGVVVLTQGLSGIGDLFQAVPLLEGITALGYPPYLLYILGPAKLAGVTVLALPRLPRLKEWAYAGLAIDFGGAFLSHALHGDGIKLMAPALLFLGLLLGSYFLRPESRRLA